MPKGTEDLLEEWLAWTCHICFFVLCLRTVLRRAMAVLPSQSFYSSFSPPSLLSRLLLPPLLPPSALRHWDIPSKKRAAQDGWRHRCAPNTVQLFSSLTLFSVFSFLFSLSLAGAFSFFPAAVTQSVGGLRTRRGLERDWERAEREEKSKCR